MTYFGCAALSQEAGEQRFGKAGMTRGWILVEHSGPWVRDAFTNHPLGLALLERARGSQVKVLAIRRHGRSARSVSEPVAFVASSTAGWVERIPYNALETLDPAVALADSPPGLSAPHSEPIYLVCTHGSKDACCAVRGRPLAAALAALRPDETWECSHLGGDRFAPNLVCLPHGLFYGHVGPIDAGGVVEAYERGELAMPFLRGRSGTPEEGQAADFLLRERIGLRDIDALSFVGSVEVSEDLFDVDLSVRGAVTRVRVRCRDDGNEPRALTCSAVERRDSWSWELEAAAELVG